MKTTSKFGKVAVALSAALSLVTGNGADSDKITKKQLKFIPVFLPSEEPSNQSTTLSLDEVSNSDRKPYFLRSGDELLLKLTNPGYEFENSVTIDNQGTVNLDLLGWVNLENKTLEQAELLLKGAYEDRYFKNPRISLRLVKKAPLRFKILGQVAQPGFYEVPPGLEVDLLDAIAIAGGYTRLANKVTYKYVTQEKKNAPAEERIKVYRIRELNRTSNSKIPVLNGGDTIVVGESIF
jgi:polysaccharide export outer membrane protein